MNKDNYFNRFGLAIFIAISAIITLDVFSIVEAIKTQNYSGAILMLIITTGISLLLIVDYNKKR